MRQGTTCGWCGQEIRDNKVYYRGLIFCSSDHQSQYARSLVEGTRSPAEEAARAVEAEVETEEVAPDPTPKRARRGITTSDSLSHS